MNRRRIEKKIWKDLVMLITDVRNFIFKRRMQSIVFAYYNTFRFRQKTKIRKYS